MAKIMVEDVTSASFHNFNKKNLLIMGTDKRYGFNKCNVTIVEFITYIILFTWREADILVELPNVSSLTETLNITGNHGFSSISKNFKDCTKKGYLCPFDNNKVRVHDILNINDKYVKDFSKILAIEKIPNDSKDIPSSLSENIITLANKIKFEKNYLTDITNKSENLFKNWFDVELEIIKQPIQQKLLNPGDLRTPHIIKIGKDLITLLNLIEAAQIITYCFTNNCPTNNLILYVQEEHARIIREFLKKKGVETIAEAPKKDKTYFNMIRQFGTGLLKSLYKPCVNMAGIISKMPCS